MWSDGVPQPLCAMVFGSEGSFQFTAQMIDEALAAFTETLFNEKFALFFAALPAHWLQPIVCL